MSAVTKLGKENRHKEYFRLLCVCVCVCVCVYTYCCIQTTVYCLIKDVLQTDYLHEKSSKTASYF